MRHLLALALCLAALLVARPSRAQQTPESIPNEIVLGFNPAENAQTLQRSADELAQALAERVHIPVRAVVTLDGLPMHEIEAPLPQLSPILRAPWFDMKVNDRPGGVVEAQNDGEEWVAAARWRIEVVRHAIDLVVPRPA
jgi:hypothetical protein